MFKPSMILPAARSSVFGRAQKAGRKKDGSAQATMNFWNGASGSRRKSPITAERNRTFQLTRAPEANRQHHNCARDEIAIMNWEMLAAIGQLAAVFVGIPSLIYVPTQIREQTKERRQSVVNALTVQWGDLTCALHDSAEFIAIYLRGVQSFDDVDPVSKVRF